VHGTQNSTVVYDASTGARRMAFWGWAIAGNGKMGLIAARNREQERIVYEAATGREVPHLTLDTAVRRAQFLPEKKQLLVLTGNPSVYTLNVPGDGKLPATQTAQAAP
jgi:hypothetical protein